MTVQAVSKVAAISVVYAEKYQVNMTNPSFALKKQYPIMKLKVFLYSPVIHFLTLQGEL